MDEQSPKTARIIHVCELIERGDHEEAATFLRTVCAGGASPRVPLSEAVESANLPPGRTERRYSAVQKTNLFLRDGFADRYSGDRLVFPGVLRLLSHLFPNEFPYHPNWKYGECHAWYWELYPTVDHVDSAGEDIAENWVTTSMIRNLKKSNSPVHAHGWSIQPPPAAPEWDGLLSWYLRYFAAHPEFRKVGYLNAWYRAGHTATTAA